MPTGIEALAAGYAPRTRKPAQSPATDALGNQPALESEDALLPKNRSAFMSALNWIGRPGQVVKNVLTGNLEGAARQAGDFALEAVDAALPGDLIPELSRPQDEIQGSALLGFDDQWRKDHPFLNLAASLPVDILTDPLTFTGFAPLLKAGGAIGKGAAAVASKLPRGAEAVQAVKNVAKTAGEGIRSIAGEQRLAKPIADAGLAANAAKSNVAEAAAAESSRIFSGFTAKELDVAGDVADGVIYDAAGRPLSLLPGESLAQRIAAHPEAAGMDPARLEQVIRDSRGFMARQAEEGGLGKPAAGVSDMLATGGQVAGKTPDLPIFTPGAGIEDYLPRVYEGMAPGSALKERSLLTPADQLDFFAKNPEVTNVRNLAQRVGNRVGKQAEMAKRATLGAEILAAVKAGTIQIPDAELETLAAGVADFKPVVLGEQAPVDLLSGLRPHIPDNVYSLGTAHGVSAPPGLPAAPANATEPLRGLTAPTGSLGDTLSKSGLAGQSGVIASKDVMRDAGSGLDLLSGAGPKVPTDVYGVGVLPGKRGGPAPVAKTARGVDPLLSLHGAATNRTPNTYGIGGVGSQGVGAFVPEAAPAAQALDPLASLAGQSKPITDLSRTLDHVMNHEFRLADPRSKAIVNAAIKGLDPESARYATDMFNGLPPRTGIMKGLASANRVIKPMMVYGYAIPKMGAMVRNVVGGAWQAFSNPATRGTAVKAMTRIPSSLVGAVVDSLGLKVPKDALGKVIALYDQTLKQSGGVASKALADLERHPGIGGYSGQQIADVFRSGAPGGFVDTEAFLKTMASTPWKQTYKHVVEWPARMFKGLEDRMRIGMGLELAKDGKPMADIGRFTKEALYDYDVTSAGNRAARDILPFAQFTFKAVPQQAKLLYEKPWLAVGMSSLMTEKEGQAVYPYMEGKLNVPLGMNEQGEQQYASGFGLPFEALGMIPNPSGSLQQTGRELERIVGGSSQPLLKSAFGLVSGEDPYFETPFGSYSKLPGNIEGGALGRAYNVAAGTGFTQPVDAPLRLLGKLADDRSSAGIKALDLLTGANVVSVNADRALQQRLTDYLRRNPDVASFESLYTRSDDPEVKSLLRQLREAKQRVKASRPAAP